MFSLSPPMLHVAQGPIYINEPCIAYRMGLQDEMVVGVFMLPCKHPYNIFYFENLCMLNDFYLAMGCNVEIPTSVNMMFHAKTMFSIEDKGIPIGMFPINQ